MNSFRSVVRSLSPFTRGRKTREEEAAEKALYEESRWQNALSRIDYHDFLELFYEKYNPEKIDTIDMILHQFAGKEPDMILVMGDKYHLSREQLLALMDEAAVDNPAPGATSTRTSTRDGHELPSYSESMRHSNNNNFNDGAGNVRRGSNASEAPAIMAPTEVNPSPEMEEMNRMRLTALLVKGAETRQSTSSRPGLSAAIASAIASDAEKNRTSSGPNMVSDVGGKRETAAAWMSPMMRSQEQPGSAASSGGPQRMSGPSLVAQAQMAKELQAQRDAQPSVEELQEELHRTRSALQAAASEKERMNKLIELIASNPDNVSGALRSFMLDNGLLSETGAPHSPDPNDMIDAENEVSPLDMGSPAYSNSYMRARNHDPPHMKPTALSRNREVFGVARAASSSGHVSPTRGEEATSPRFMVTRVASPPLIPDRLDTPMHNSPVANNDTRSLRSGVRSASPALSRADSTSRNSDAYTASSNAPATIQ